MICSCPKFYIYSIPACCVFHNFTHFFFGPCQMPIRTMFPKFYAIFRWSPQKFKIGSLLYIVDLLGVLLILLITCCIL